MRRLTSHLTVGIFTFALGIGVTYIRSDRPISEDVKEQSTIPAQTALISDDGPNGNEQANPSVGKQPEYTSLLQRVETVAGTVEIIDLAPLTWRINLNGKTILETHESLMPDILIHAKRRISPYDEVMVFERQEGTYCNGGTFWFLGLKRDGSYRLSEGIGRCFADSLKVDVGSNYVRVRVRGGYGNNRSPGEPYLPGGTWLFRNGQVRRIESANR